jgi:formate hydrogenlyase transcriptional activator
MELVSVPGASPSPRPPVGTSLKDTERELIVRTLEQCHWRVGGPTGAAVRLGMKRTTLLSRMKKLDLHRPSDGKVSE